MIKYDADEIKINNENMQLWQDCFIIRTRKKNHVYIYAQPIETEEILKLILILYKFLDVQANGPGRSFSVLNRNLMMIAGEWKLRDRPLKPPVIFSFNTDTEPL